MNHRPPAKILIVDDHPMVCEGIVMRISGERDLEVCGQASTINDALTLVDETNADLLIIDISLKGCSGIDLIKRVRSQHPAVKMLVFSGCQESVYAERALRAGALGYLNKQEPNDKLVEAIRTVLKGDRFVSPQVAQRLMNQALGNRKGSPDSFDQLTDRELEILRMIGEGVSTGTIARQLHISTHTIDTHRENIKRKLGARNAAELSRQAVQWLLENG
jgi:DNA-binding NarL/FixJ family response regulator